MEEIRTTIGEINKSLEVYQSHYPRVDWDKDATDDLILNFSYHSNKIEGLHLSYGETISFLKHGIIENKKLQDEETLGDITMLSNHKKALELILSEYKRKEISIEFIKSIHEEILKTDTFLDDLNNPGHYRGDDAMVRRSDGTIKYFLYDNQIPEAMERLVQRTNACIISADLTKLDLHPFTIAVNLHVDFLNIHPFRDGNGRMARLLMNMVNMKFKIPPFSPKSDKENRLKYFEAFNEVDKTGSSAPMINFLGTQLVEVMEVAIGKASNDT